MTQQDKGSDLLEAVVIGSGFGGSVSFCRLAAKWQDKVLLLERGKRYPMGSFPRAPGQMAHNFWTDPGEGGGAARRHGGQGGHGLFDIRNYKKMDVVISAGLGGGSLIYANVFLPPPPVVFAQGWPRNLGLATLQPYYRVAKSVLGARPLPPARGDARRQVTRTEVFRKFAASEGKVSRLADICVFFGRDYAHHPGGEPLPIGWQERNRYGAPQTSCTYCGECDLGCNTHSKNTLDLNYLHAGEAHHGGRIETEAVVGEIVPLNEAGLADPAQDGRHGYLVRYRQGGEARVVRARRVIVSAGTLGTNELLLRCRDHHKTLPRLSAQLGHRFSGNGDFVSVVVDGEKVANPNYGPVITQYADFNLFEDHRPGRAFLLEDAAYPAFVAWLVEGVDVKGWFRKAFASFWWLIKHGFQRLFSRWSGSFGEFFQRVLAHDLPSRSHVLLCMGQDAGDGVLSLRDGNLDIHWPQESSASLYDAIERVGRNFRDHVRSWCYSAIPTWWWPFRNNITVHPLGGCALADSPEEGVVSAGKDRGQVFGYQGLYVADGSLMPTALGANPAATITALAEWIAEGITGQSPDDSLGVPYCPPA